jgi:hypothetical protein
MKLVLASLLALAAARPEDTNFEGEAEATTEAAIDEDGLNVRQASRQVNCNCQCSSITFLDKFGKVNGNCRSSDTTGAVWCYVDPRYSQCADLQRSTRTSSLWSYQACATPDLASPQCAFNNGGFPNNNGGFPNNNNGGFINNGGIPNNGFNNNNNGGFPSNGFNNNNGGFPSNGFNNNNGGFPNNGFNNNNGGISSGIRGSGSPLVGTSNPGFSLSSGSSSSGLSSGPEGFPFQESGGFQAVLSVAEKKATAAKEEEKEEEAEEEGSDAVSFSR